MTKAFNLLEERWLPVRDRNGCVRDVGLLELFERAHEIEALAEAEPPSLIAEYRLLLAILHRALTTSIGTWKDSDRARWYADGFPLQHVRHYLERNRERFWLFHPEHPFMQVAALGVDADTRDRPLKPWTQVSLASAVGNAPVLFDHACDETPPVISPARALRLLLGYLQFVPGGLVKALRDSDKAGPLADTAAILPLGRSILQTLILNLHLPTAKNGEDLASWEKNPVTIQDLRSVPTLATGPNDRYTRLTRAALFVGDSGKRVTHLRFAAGLSLAEDANAPDPMTSYQAGRQRSLVRLTFVEGRAFWRDLTALVPDASGKASIPAAVLNYAANLHGVLTLKVPEQQVLAAGAASDQRKILRWRCEQIDLPVQLLSDPTRADFLRLLIRHAESTFGDVRRAATGMVRDSLPDSTSREAGRSAREIFEATPATFRFFGEAERALGQVIGLIVAGDTPEAERHWQRALLTGTEGVWSCVREALGHTAATTRAEARNWTRFRALLRNLQDEGGANETEETKTEDAGT